MGTSKPFPQPCKFVGVRFNHPPPHEMTQHHLRVGLGTIWAGLVLRTGPKLPGPSARAIWDRFLVRPRYTYGPNLSQTGPRMVFGSSQGRGWFYGRFVYFTEIGNACRWGPFKLASKRDDRSPSNGRSGPFKRVFNKADRSPLDGFPVREPSRHPRLVDANLPAASRCLKPVPARPWGDTEPMGTYFPNAGTLRDNASWPESGLPSRIPAGF